MPIFRPPTDPLVAWAETDERGIFRAMARGARGRNVFKLTDGTYTEDQPWPDDLIAITYHGGHIHEVDATEAAALTAAGYGDYIS